MKKLPAIAFKVAHTSPRAAVRWSLVLAHGTWIAVRLAGIEFPIIETVCLVTVVLEGIGELRH